SSVHSYQLTLRWDEISVNTYGRASIVSEQVNQEDGVEITGEVRNVHRSALNNLVVVATFYDENGEVLDVVRGQTHVTSLAPEETTTFSVQSSESIPFASYLVQ